LAPLEEVPLVPPPPLPPRRPPPSTRPCCSACSWANSLALAPSGKRVAVGLQDREVQIWDLETEAVVHTLRGHKQTVNHVAYSSDGKRIASASSDKTVRLWRDADGRCEAELKGHLHSVAAVAFSADSTQLASGGWDTNICLWDVEQCAVAGTGQAKVLSGHTDWIHSMAWAPHGRRRLASSSSDHTVRVWSATWGAVEQVLVGHLQTVSSVCFSPDGNFLASGSLDRTVRLYDLEEQTLKARFELESHEASVRCVAFTPDGKCIVVGSGDRAVRVWNVSAEEDTELCGHEEAVLSVCVSADGDRAVSCGHDYTLRVWRMPRGALAAKRTVSPLSRDGAVAAVAPEQGELRDRLRSTEDSNQRLRRQLMEARTAIEETNQQVRKHNMMVSSFSSMEQKLRETEDANQQLRRQLSEAHKEIARRATWIAPEQRPAEEERRLADFRGMISNLTAEKEKLERSLEETRQELRQFPTFPAGHGATHRSSEEASPTARVRPLPPESSVSTSERPRRRRSPAKPPKQKPL